MAVSPCGMCEERPGDYIVSAAATGDTMWLCTPCLPVFVAAVFEQAGMPGLEFGFGDDEPELEQPAEPADDDGESSGAAKWAAAVAAIPTDDDGETVWINAEAPEAPEADDNPPAAPEAVTEAHNGAGRSPKAKAGAAKGEAATDG